MTRKTLIRGYMKEKIVATLTAALLFSQMEAKTPSNCGCRCGTFEIGADWLYWKDFQDNLQYASIITTTGDEVTTIDDIEPIGPKFEVNSGFRVYADYVFGSCPWMISASYSRWTSHTSRDTAVGIESNSVIVLNPLLEILDVSDLTFFSLNSDWDTHVNFFDLDFSYSFCVCNWFDIIPHFGFRGVWIKQKLDLDGIGLVEGATSVLTTELEQTFHGYGLEGGLRANLRLCWGFSLVGFINTSLLYSRVDVDNTLRVTIAEAITGADVDEKIWHLSPVFDGFIGLEFRRQICSCFWTLHAGWETHLIMDINHFEIFDYANLTLQGLTLGGSVVF